MVLGDKDFFVQLPLDSPYITMVEIASINNKSLSPSTILYPEGSRLLYTICPERFGVEFDCKALADAETPISFLIQFSPFS